MDKPELRSLHPASSLSSAKLEAYGKISTRGLLDSLKPGEVGALKVRPDGVIMDGHHRIEILRERGVDVDVLPREVEQREESEDWS